jgi:FkbM family methyltransferase
MKKVIKIFFRSILNFLPDSILPWFLSSVPHANALLPDGKQILFNKYLGDLCVRVNTTYPIEREMLSGSYDPLTQFVISTLVREGDNCLDIGANVGAISLSIAKATGHTGRVFAFEPGPELFARLVENLRLNPVISRIITPVQLGLGEKEGNLFWHEHPNHCGNADLSEKQTPQSISVKVTTVDNYFSNMNFTKIDFVKIDVESMEFEVIKGGIATWRKFRPVIYYETLRAFEEYRTIPVFKLIEQLLSSEGYTFFKIDNCNKITPTAYPNLSDNTLAVPHEKADSTLLLTPH